MLLSMLLLFYRGCCRGGGNGDVIKATFLLINSFLYFPLINFLTRHWLSKAIQFRYIQGHRVMARISDPGPEIHKVAKAKR